MEASGPWRFYSDADLLRELGARQKSPVALAIQALAIQAQLTLDFVAADARMAIIENVPWAAHDDRQVVEVARRLFPSGSSRPQDATLRSATAPGTRPWIGTNGAVTPLSYIGDREAYECW